MRASAAPEAILDPRPHHLRRVHVLALMPHSRCNCRCLMCDIWKANRAGTRLTPDLIGRLSADLRALGVEEVLLTGGEPLMHSELWSLCALLKKIPARITLLSTGLLLARHAEAIVQWCDEVIVSLDGSESIHNSIRGTPGGFAKLATGVAALKRRHPDFPISARCVLQKRNFRDLPNIVAAAHAMGLNRISFLAADLSSTAFNRPNGWESEHTDQVCLSENESTEFLALIETFIAENSNDFVSGFIAERPDRLRQLGHYYQAMHGLRSFPPIRCTAPWVSTVIEADGTVRPCFFHAPLGNVHTERLPAILNSDKAAAFRENLDMRSDPVCSRCVCTFNL